jgi:predicted acyltransferase
VKPPPRPGQNSSLRTRRERLAVVLRVLSAIGAAGTWAGLCWFLFFPIEQLWELPAFILVTAGVPWGGLAVLWILRGERGAR